MKSLVAALLGILVADVMAQDIPVGRSSQDHPAGLKVELVVPRPDPEGAVIDQLVWMGGRKRRSTGG